MSVYTMNVAGIDAQIPFSSIQCRRRVGASTWIDVKIPFHSAAFETEIRLAIGSTISIQYEGADFLSAVMTDVTAEINATAAIISLTGRVQTPSYTQTHHSLTGVTDRRADSGRRFCRCSIDPLLRPNDIVDDGAETWTAGIIFYRIMPNSGQMDVTEIFNG